MNLIGIEWIVYTVSVWSIHVAVSSNMSQFYIEKKGNQFFELGGFFFESTMKIFGSKQHPIVPFTLSTRFKDLDLTLVIYHTTLLIRGVFSLKVPWKIFFRNEIQSLTLDPFSHL